MNNGETKNIVYIYGINPVFEVLRARRREVLEAWLSTRLKQNSRWVKLKRLLNERGVKTQLLDRGTLSNRVGTKEHQGIVLKCSPLPEYPLSEQWKKNRLLLPDNIEDPHNLGAILRSAEVFGFEGVLLPCKGVSGLYASVIKASAGASEHLNISRCCTANRYASKAHEKGFSVIALDAKGNGTLQEFKSKTYDKILLVVGGENKSVGQYILNMADATLKIPQFGHINSLNASVAASVAMYDIAQKTSVSRS